MRNQYLIILSIISVQFADACTWNYQQSFWSVIESQVYANDVELSECVNEYIFCELQENCDKFLQELSSQSHAVQDMVIEELKRPISDIYSISEIETNLAISEVDNRLKTNLLKALSVGNPILQNQHTMPTLL